MICFLLFVLKLGLFYKGMMLLEWRGERPVCSQCAPWCLVLLHSWSLSSLGRAGTAWAEADSHGWRGTWDTKDVCNKGMATDKSGKLRHSSWHFVECVHTWIQRQWPMRWKMWASDCISVSEASKSRSHVQYATKCSQIALRVRQPRLVVWILVSFMKLLWWGAAPETVTWKDLVSLFCVEIWWHVAMLASWIVHNASHASNLAQPLFLTGGIFLAEGAEMLIMGWHPGFLLWFGIEGRIVEPRFHHLASTSALGPQPCHSWWHGFHSCLASVDYVTDLHFVLVV